MSDIPKISHNSSIRSACDAGRFSMKDYPEVHCHECGKTQKACYIDETKAKMVERSLCFKCLFWTEYVELQGTRKQQQTIVNGKHFMACPPTNSPFKGFGGTSFLIRYHDGRAVQCSNVWHQGEIPDHFKSRLPDNAVFVYEKILEDQPTTQGQPHPGLIENTPNTPP